VIRFSLCEPRDCLLQSLLELDHWSPIQPLYRSTDVWTAALWIIYHRSDMADSGFGADDLGHQIVKRSVARWG